MASILSSPSATHSRYLLEVPGDDEHQRGRKRRRSSESSPPAQTPSGGTNLRGRGRRRSHSLQASSPASQSPLQARSSQPNAHPPTTLSPEHDRCGPSPSGSKKQQEKSSGELRSVPKAKKRRSQSPSRSQSAGGGEVKRRRRRRTRSRSREHDVKRDAAEDAPAEGEGGSVAVEDDSD